MPSKIVNTALLTVYHFAIEILPFHIVKGPLQFSVMIETTDILFAISI